jgi:hypothetical protein
LKIVQTKNDSVNEINIFPWNSLSQMRVRGEQRMLSLAAVSGLDASASSMIVADTNNILLRTDSSSFLNPPKFPIPNGVMRPVAKPGQASTCCHQTFRESTDLKCLEKVNGYSGSRTNTNSSSVYLFMREFNVLLIVLQTITLFAGYFCFMAAHFVATNVFFGLRDWLYSSDDDDRNRPGEPVIIPVHHHNPRLLALPRNKVSRG